jgi:hypothetical protein
MTLVLLPYVETVRALQMQCRERRMCYSHEFVGTLCEMDILSSVKDSRYGFQFKVLLGSNDILITIAYFWWRGGLFSYVKSNFRYLTLVPPSAVF